MANKPTVRFRFGQWGCWRKPGDGVIVGFGKTPPEAFRKWFEFTRLKALGLISDSEMIPTVRLLRVSSLGRTCFGLVKHDRYLLGIDGGGDAQRH